MRTRIADQLSSLLLKASLLGRKCLTKQTPSPRVRELIEALRPVMTQAPLVRIGPEGDGGYLVPDSLSGISACFSPGVSTEAGFELQCAERGMDVFLADGSVNAPPVNHRRFRFTQKHIGLVDDQHTITLDSWISEAGIDEDDDLLLQMDIEGLSTPHSYPCRLTGSGSSGLSSSSFTVSIFSGASPPSNLWTVCFANYSKRMRACTFTRTMLPRPFPMMA